MKTLKERFIELSTGIQKDVAQRLIEEVVVGTETLMNHVIIKDNMKQYDELGSAIFKRVSSDAALLAGLLKYDDINKLYEDILNTDFTK